MVVTTKEEAVGMEDSREAMVVMMGTVALRAATEVAMEPRVAATIREVVVVVTRAVVATRAPRVADTVVLKLEGMVVPRAAGVMEVLRAVEVLLGDTVELREVDMEAAIRTTTSADQRRQDGVPVKELPGEAPEVDTDRTR